MTSVRTSRGQGYQSAFFLAAAFFLAGAFFFAAFFLRAFFAGAFFFAAPRLGFFGPVSRRTSSSAARSGVMPSTVSPLRSEAL